jgi:hypothetical protein
LVNVTEAGTKNFTKKSNQNFKLRHGVEQKSRAASSIFVKSKHLLREIPCSSRGQSTKFKNLPIGRFPAAVARVDSVGSLYNPGQGTRRHDVGVVSRPNNIQMVFNFLVLDVEGHEPVAIRV